MDDHQLIQINEIPSDQTGSPENQYQEWVARFCYASAKLPPKTVEHLLDLMETCGDSSETGLPFKEGNA